MGPAVPADRFVVQVETRIGDPMSDRVVVHSVKSDAAPASDVLQRLRDKGIEIIEQQPHMVLVSGDLQTVSQALGDALGWSVSKLTTTPPPSTRERVLKRP